MRTSECPANSRHVNVVNAAVSSAVASATAKLQQVAHCECHAIGGRGKPAADWLPDDEEVGLQAPRSRGAARTHTDRVCLVNHEIRAVLSIS